MTTYCNYKFGETSFQFSSDPPAQPGFYLLDSGYAHEPVGVLVERDGPGLFIYLGDQKVYLPALYEQFGECMWHRIIQPE